MRRKYFNMPIKINDKSINPRDFIKEGLREEFDALFDEGRRDKSFHNDLMTAYLTILYLGHHIITGSPKSKFNPKDAFEMALKHFPNADKNTVKPLVAQFSIRGDEFQAWMDNPENWETVWELEKED
jgi:hypothetical protein